MNEAVDLYIADMRTEGRISSDRSERTYRALLGLHAADVSNRDPRAVGREDIKRTLSRWTNPNTYSSRRSTLVSFYRWTMEEGIRETNPAEQTRRPKRRPVNVYRLNRAEVAAMLSAATGHIEIRAVHLALYTGLRSGELRGLRGAEFAREGFVHVPGAIAKGGRERWVPVADELRPVVQEVRANVAPGEFVLPGQVVARVVPLLHRWEPSRPMSAQTVWRMVGRVAERAGVTAHIYPHLLRHAFADHIARAVGIRQAQVLLGHADISTTQKYTGQPTLDELADAMSGLRLGPAT